MNQESVSIALTGSGGAGVMTAGQNLLNAAARAGFYGRMSRSLGPQIRGGESAALIRLGTAPVAGPDDAFHMLLAFDWGNIERFFAELPLTSNSLIIADPAQGDIPVQIASSGARLVHVAFGEIADAIPGGRANMVGLGVIGALAGIPLDVLQAEVAQAIARKGADAQRSSAASVAAGAAAAATVGTVPHLGAPPPHAEERWSITGNEAAGLGALRGGIRFTAAYPITPATEVLEWLAPNLPKVGGTLVQAEDELASIAMCLGASYGGVPSLTATSGPGLVLMAEALGLGVAAEVPVVVVNVMRGGPSTGIPTKSEQSDLNLATYGMHGDAPHVVMAANSVPDCLHTTEWAVHVAEAVQCPTIVLSDQAMGQSRLIVDKPPPAPAPCKRRTPEGDIAGYARYAVTADGISAMALPGMPGGEYTAEGLEHSPTGMPSSKADHHREQLDKRARKLERYYFGARWADIEDFGGDGVADIAIITWGSVTAAAREAAARVAKDGRRIRVISVRLITPAQPARMTAALGDIPRALVVEQTHSGQFHHFLRAHYDLPAEVKVLKHPGPLPLRPREIEAGLNWE